MPLLVVVVFRLFARDEGREEQTNAECDRDGWRWVSRCLLLFEAKRQRVNINVRETNREGEGKERQRGI